MSYLHQPSITFEQSLREDEMLCEEQLEITPGLSIQDYAMNVYTEEQDKVLKSSKKNNKNKKKRRALEKQVEVKKDLQKIVEGIYWDNQTYLSLEPKIQEVIARLHDSSRFYDILDQSIKDYIEYLKDDIWDCMEREIWKEQFLDVYSYSTAIPEYPEFYICLISQLHKKYKVFQKASNEIEMILNSYNKQYSSIYKENKPGDLCKRTFNLFIWEDEFFRKFIRCCQRMFQFFHKGNHNSEVMNKLMEILEVAKPIEMESDTEDIMEEEDTDQTLTSNEDQFQSTEKKKKKKKKNKRKNPDVASVEAPQIIEIQEMELFERIEGISSNDLRLRMEVSDDWVDTFKKNRNR